MSKTTKPYYTLAVKPPEQPWSPQFGDFEKEVVEQELVDTKKDWPKGSKFKVIKTKDTQVAINEGIGALNNVNT